MAKFLYFQNSAKTNDSSFVYLPTLFFSNTKWLFKSSPCKYNSTILDLQLWLSIWKVTCIASMMWEDNHYSSTFHWCDGSYEHGDSLMWSPPANAVNIFQWLLQGLDPMEYTPPSNLTSGAIGLQLLGGAGSCAVAAHNFIKMKVDPLVPLWEAAASTHSCQSILHDLIIYQIAAANSLVQHVIAIWIASYVRLINPFGNSHTSNASDHWFLQDWLGIMDSSQRMDSMGMLTSIYIFLW